MAKRDSVTGDSKYFVSYLLKKSQEKDPEPQKHEDNVKVEEVEELVRKIKEKIRA